MSRMTKAETPQRHEPTAGDMSPEEFRRFGHEVVDWILGYLARPHQNPATRAGGGGCGPARAAAVVLFVVVWGPPPARPEEYPVLAQVEPGQLRSQLPPSP